MEPQYAAFFGAFVGGAIVSFGNWIISIKERAAKFKLAGLEKRLVAHSEAYRHWYDLMWSLNDDEKRGDEANKSQQWWVDNQFYLDKKSSDAFKTATVVAATFGEYVPTSDRDAKERQKAFRTMHKVGNLLREGIGLPHLEDKKTWQNKILGENT